MTVRGLSVEVAIAAEEVNDANGTGADSDADADAEPGAADADAEPDADDADDSSDGKDQLSPEKLDKLKAIGANLQDREDKAKNAAPATPMAARSLVPRPSQTPAQTPVPPTPPTARA